METRFRGSVTSVTVRGLKRAFDDRAVLRGLDLEIAPGEFVAMLGHSGSGKSTLLRILAGLDDETDGTVDVPAARSVVFQTPRLLPWKRVLDNVTFNLRTADPRRAGLRALAEVGLADLAGAWPVTLSGGEAQRVALARALVREPDLLLLDEPFGALDALTRIRMHRLLAELCARHQPSVLLVTHDVDEAILLADRVVVLHSGVIALDRRVDLPPSRSRADLGFTALRDELLRQLGVEEQLSLTKQRPPSPRRQGPLEVVS